MSVARLFDALAAHAPEAQVLVGGDRAWNAAEVLAEVDGLSARLSGCRTLAVLADNGPAWVMADLAALRSGAIHVPLPAFFDAGQLSHIVHRTGAEVVLTDQPRRIHDLDAGYVVGGEWCGLAWMTRAVAADAMPAMPAGTAKISFTSGSTGSPKGACLSAAGLIDTAAAVAARLADLPIRRHLAVLPLALLLENSAGLYAPLLRGAEIHLPGLASLGWRGMAGFDPAVLHRTVVERGPNSLILVPELLKAWTLYLAGTGQQAPDGLVYAAVGGARGDAAALGQAHDLGLPAYQGYGLTECGSVVSLNCPGDEASEGDDVGRPLGHVAVRIEAGEIRIAARAFLGYLDDPAAPSDDREFATGDLGHVDARGHLRLSGRGKHLLITSYGRNIAPEWIEAGLLAQPAILQAVVMGDARPWLGAVLVPAAGVDTEALAAAVAAVNAALPDYARVGAWLVAAPFTVANGQATGNGRPIRHAILSHHAAALAALYPDKEPADVVL